MHKRCFYLSKYLEPDGYGLCVRILQNEVETEVMGCHAKVAFTHIPPVTAYQSVSACLIHDLLSEVQVC